MMLLYVIAALFSVGFIAEMHRAGGKSYVWKTIGFLLFLVGGAAYVFYFFGRSPRFALYAAMLYGGVFGYFYGRMNGYKEGYNKRRDEEANEAAYEDQIKRARND